MKKNVKILIYVGAVLVVGLITFLVIHTLSLQSETKKMAEQKAQLELQNQQLSLAGEYEQLNADFVNYENQTKFLKNDSLTEKYSEAKDKVEKLLTELKTQKITSEKRINELKNEISTLKNLMRHYIEQIDSLSKENQGLKTENQAIKSENQRLNSQVSAVSQKNAVLSEKMTLAEKLNITGLNLTPLKSNGKEEKKVTKAKQLKVSFTILQNNSTPVGQKTLYVRITNPEGSLLGGAGSFTFEGSTIPYTDRKTVEYTGEEMPNVTIYWNVNATLTPGQYRVEVFADNFRIASRNFTLEK